MSSNCMSRAIVLPIQVIGFSFPWHRHQRFGMGIVAGAQPVIRSEAAQAAAAATSATSFTARRR